MRRFRGRRLQPPWRGLSGARRFDALTRSEETVGVLCVALSAAAFSTAGLFTRVIDLDVWTLLFWRGLLGGTALLAFMVATQGRGATAALRLTRAGWLAALCSALSTICFIHALRLTTVADVTVTFATTPFLAALLSWVWARRAERRSTLVASLVAFVGVAILAGWSSGSSHSLTGVALALVAAGLVAALIVVLRENPRVSFLPAACVSGFLCAGLVWPAAAPEAAQGRDFLWLAAFAVIQFAVGLVLLIRGAPKISPARSGLISSLETPLAPLLVWAAFAETPSMATLIGGAIVMAAVIADILLSGAEPEREA